jgi:SAM-dependent methyltransferase
VDARTRATAEGLQIVFEEADAESLPYEDGQFDVVTSLIGAMFAPRPDLVAAELTRVCRPGGMIAMANWTPEGFVGQMFKTIAKHIALPVVEFFRTNYGPMSRAFASLDATGQERLRNDLVALWSARNYANGNSTKVDAEYLEVIAKRDRNHLAAQQNHDARKTRGHVSHRAGLLTGRIEEGAGSLAGFAEGISETEWQSPVPGTDRRSIDIIVHHVASMYPIEIEVARVIASGKRVTDITWEGVANLNAKHAQEQASVTKSAALDLLRRNSHDAASGVREFTVEELDRAAPFSLAFGAPVTASSLRIMHYDTVGTAWHAFARPWDRDLPMEHLSHRLSSTHFQRRTSI